MTTAHDRLQAEEVGNRDAEGEAQRRGGVMGGIVECDAFHIGDHFFAAFARTNDRHVSLLPTVGAFCMSVVVGERGTDGEWQMRLRRYFNSLDTAARFAADALEGR